MIAHGHLAEGYLNNREAFDFFTCRFQVLTGMAQTEEDAVNGNLSESGMQEGFWLVHGQKVRYELKADPRFRDASKSAKWTAEGNGRFTGTLPPSAGSEQYLTDGAFQMRYSPIVRSASVVPPTERLVGIINTPFSMGVMGQNEEFSPGALLQDCVKGGRAGNVIGSEKVDSAELLTVSIAKRGEEGAWRLGLDTERGFLPVRISQQFAEEKVGRLFEGRILEVKACSKGRWFPYRSVVISVPDGKPPYQVRIIRVVRLDVEQAPPDEDFFLDVPKGTQINDPVRLAAMLLPKNERLQAGGLKALHERLIEHDKKETRESKIRGSVHSAGRISGLKIAAITVAVVLAGGIAFLYVRRRFRDSVN